MKKIALFTLFLLLLTTSLNAYSKKIVFSAFSNAQNASSSLQEYKNTKEYQRLFELSQENGFKIYYRASGKYFVIIAEPILNKDVGIEAFELVKSKYTSAYTMLYVEDKKDTKAKKIVIAEKVIEKIVRTVEDKNSSINNEVSKKAIVPEIKESNKTVALNSEQNTTTLKIEKTIKKEEKKEIISEVYKEEKKEFLDIWTIIRYIVIFFFLFVVTFYYMKFKRLYDEY